MEENNHIYTSTKLPQIRRITNLDSFETTAVSKLVPPVKIKKEFESDKSSYRLLVMGVIFIVIFSVEVAIIHRYDRLNKRLYQISLNYKDKYIGAVNSRNNIIKSASGSRKSILRAYHRYSDLTYRLRFSKFNYKSIILSQASKAKVLLGELNVYMSKIEALKAQNEVLMAQASGLTERIQELSAQLLTNIGEQELLVNKNIKLEAERNRLEKELAEVKMAETE